MDIKSAFFALLFYFSFDLRSATDTKFPIIKTTKGPVKGIKLTSESGKAVDAFLGIPYAKPPIGKNRFRHPEPTDPWTEVFDASKKPNTCVHVIDVFKSFPDYEEIMAPNTPLSEDCLMLNVWVPSPKPQKSAVMVWIYGGGFIMGSSSLDIYDMKTLASEQNIIAVSLNYRVSSLGFLYLGRPDAPGNAGLYDQALALQWVKDNIAAFGGDPGKVTIFGESAGGASVSFHLLSPISKGLFNRAILQSGTANCAWATHDHNSALHKGLDLARKVNCPSDPNNIDAVIECLLTKDPKDLTTVEETDIKKFPFGPIVDGNMVTEDPQISLKNRQFKQTEILIGSNKEEGSMFLAMNMDGFNFTEELYLSRNHFLGLVESFDPVKSPVSTEAIVFEYTNWEDPDNSRKNIDALEKLIGDIFITCATVDFAQSYAEAGNPVYQYEFGRRFSLKDRPEWIGVPHGEDVMFVFGRPLNKNHKFPPDEIEFTKRLIAYWANFARTGNPNISPSGKKESIEWPPYSVTGKEYLPLRDNSDKPGHALRARKCAFWRTHLPRLMELTGGKQETEGFCVIRCLKQNAGSVVVGIVIILILKWLFGR